MIKDFFLLCSGVDQDLIRECSNGEQNKYAGIGATVFFTAVLAAIASGYALYTVFDNIYTAVFFGIIWGSVIFNLDRYIVSTMRKKDSFQTEFLQAVPRIILAFIIAIVISKPLELRIFEKEINQVLLEEKNQMTLDNKEQIAGQFKQEIGGYTSEISALKEEITAKEKEVNALYETYIAEAEGRKGTKKIGKGPVYKEKKAKHDQMLSELQTLKETNTEKINALESNTQKLKEEERSLVEDAQPIIANVDGLMARINALDKLPWLPSFFIFLLFLAIETAPILTKLISSKGEYDHKMAHQESVLVNWIKQQKYQQNIQLKTDTEITDSVYKDLKQDQEVYSYKHEVAKNILQVQAEAFARNQKNVL